SKKMKYNIPDQFMGKSLKELMKEPVKTPEQKQNPINVQSLNSYIYVPSIKLHIAKKRSLLGLDWNDTQTELKKQNLAMPTPYQFREFLKYLRDSHDTEHQGLFKEITEVREPWRAEWLNARFEKDGRDIYLASENALVNGKYEFSKQKLIDCLTEDKTPGISLDAWLDSNATHGLPLAKTSKGDLYYWAPVNGTVSRFYAGSGWTGLDCGGDPSFSYSHLGVRAVMLAKSRI
ncbi:MAG: hypothetical protein KKA64_00750, partial [Nanoarchaeota archaeon]|nr:hypothetical protein [Nanoarchaeota archaeon]